MKDWKIFSRSRANLGRTVGLVALLVSVLVLTTVSSGAAPFIKKWSERKSERMRAHQEETRSLLDAALARSEEKAPMLRDVEAERRKQVIEARQAFYQQRGYEPAWLDNGKPMARVNDYLTMLGRADELGLIPNAYGLTPLGERLGNGKRAWRRKSLEDQMDFEVAMTTSFMLFALDNVQGRIDPASLDVEWHTENRKIDPAVLLTETLEGSGLKALEEVTLPWTARSVELRKMLVNYRQLAANGGWQQVPEGETLEVGDQVARQRLEAIVARLQAEGDLEPGPAEAIKSRWSSKTGAAQSAAEPASSESATSESATAMPKPDASDRLVYDQELQDAVERFQRRNGLEIDGKLGPNTIAAMNVTADERVRQIEVNLERLRWMPEEQEGRRIMVNIPEFRLEAFDDDGRRVLEMPVVVGRETWQTPVFHDQMTYVEINPTWNVPQSIAVSETLREVQKDPSYLTRKNFDVLTPSGEAVDASSIDWSSVSASGFPYRFRQRPGPDNALGQIKFMFPNQFNVYLHDTPAERGFKVADRSLSHGCVRVERPLDLAEYVFAPLGEWSKERVAEVISTRQITRVSLDEPLPVYLLYQTAFLDENGTPHFRRDVYEQDSALAKALDQLKRG